MKHLLKKLTLLALALAMSIGAWAQVPEVQRTNEDTWVFAMPAGNRALGITYKADPQMAWTLDGQPMPAAGLTAYYGFHLPVIAQIGISVSDNFMAVINPTARLAIPASWSGNNNPITVSDMPGFVGLTDDEAATFACPDTVGIVRLIHGFQNGGYIRIVQFNDGVKQGASATLAKQYNDCYNDSTSYAVKYYYTTGTGVVVRYGSTNPSVVTFADSSDATTINVLALGECDIYVVFDGNDDYSYDSVAFHATILPPPTLSIAALGNGSVTPVIGNIVWDNNIWSDKPSSFSPLGSLSYGDITISGPNIYKYESNPTQLYLGTFYGSVTFSTVGDNFRRIELIGITNPLISPSDEWTIHNDTAVWEGDAPSVSIAQCTTFVSQINFVCGNTTIAATNTPGQYLVMPGSEVKVVATANDGNFVDSWSNNAAITNHLGDTNTFTMPNSDMTLSATFAQIPLLTLTSNEGGSLALVGYNPGGQDTAYSNTLTSQELYDLMTVIDANGTDFKGDGSWRMNTYNYAAEYKATSDMGADDWLITPGITLNAGTTYTFSIDRYCDNASKPERFEVKAASEDIVDSLSSGVVVIEPTEVSNTNPAISSGTFTPTTSGIYYFGIHATSEVYRSRLLVRNLYVTYTIPTTYPDGVTAGETEGTFHVFPGTELTVTATPDSAHYFANWNGEAAVNSDTATFTMGTDDMTLTANFAQIPLLTLTSNEGGTVALDGYVAGGTTASELNIPNTWANDINGKLVQNELGSDFTPLTKEEAKLWRGAQPSGYSYLIYGFNGNNAQLLYYVDGTFSQEAEVNYPHTNLYNIKSISGKVYYTTGTVPGVIPEGITAGETEGTFRVFPGTEVTVTATPDSAHYFANWVGDTAVNSNTAVTTTFTMGGDNLTLTANFAAKPVLTLASNNSERGFVTLGNNGGGDAETLLFSINASDTFTSGSQTFDGKATVTLDGTMSYSSTYGWQSSYGNGNSGTLTVTSTDDYTITRCVFVLKDSNYTRLAEPFAVYFYTFGSLQGVYSDAEHSHKLSSSVLGINVYGHSNIPAGVAKLTDTTYSVEYGTEVTAIATANNGYHVNTWSNNDEVTNYLSDTATITMGSDDLTLTANFAANPLLTLSGNEGGSVAIDGVIPGEVTYNINVNGTTYTNVTFPFSTTVTLSNGAYDHSADFPVSVISFSGSKCTISVSQPFVGDKYISYRYDDGMDMSFGSRVVTCTPVQHYNCPAGITAGDTEGTFHVFPGTEFTVTTTPDSAHYFANWVGDTAVNSNTAVTTTFTMPSSDTTLTANFAAKPVLTLASNNSEWGSVAPVGPTIWNNQTWSGWTFNGGPSFPITVGDITISQAGMMYCYYKSSTSKLYISKTLPSDHGSVTFTSAGNNFTRIEMTYTDGSGLEPASEWTLENGVAVWEGNAPSVSITGATNFDIPQIKFIRGDNNFAKLTDSTYRVDYGAEVTVTATPDSAHYLVNWNGEDAINSNTVVTSTFTMPSGDTTLTANFAAKPVLTLASNNSEWGSVEIGNANEVENISVGATTGLYTGTHFKLQFTNPNYQYGESGFVVKSGQNATLTSTDGKIIKKIEMYVGAGNMFSHYTTSNRGTVQAPHQTYFVTINNINDTQVVISNNAPYGSSVRFSTMAVYYEGENFPSEVAVLSDTTFRVDYGTELTIKANAAELHHVADWVNADSVAYNTANITYSNYFATVPENLFPGNSTLTMTVTTDTLAEAIFGINYRNLYFAHNEGGHLEFLVPQDSLSFSGISTTSVTMGDITISATQADEDGMYLRNESDSITIAIQGGSSITQVDFHITNGSNLVSTIGTNAVGATITSTDNNEYGSIKDLNTTNLVINSSTIHDLQIDQFIVHYGKALPNGVDYNPEPNTWYVMPDTTVIVRAIPDDGHYLVSWGVKENVTVLDTLTASITVTDNDTLSAIFAPNPVITLAVNDEAAGSVYFTGYQGNTITRAGIVKAHNVDLPYQWYEAGEIMSIEGGNGMITKDEATSHYITVSGVFDGTATVVTSAGAFSLTSYPSLPNGVRYNIADDNYTVNPYTTLSFTATPNSNSYYFVDWAKVTENDTLGVDSLIFSTDPVTSVFVNGDMKLQGNFLHNPFVLTLEADPVMGTISVDSADFVTFNVDGTYTVMTDSTVTIRAAANAGYHITGWSNGTDVYSLTADTMLVTIVSDSTITINFSSNPVVTLAANGNGFLTIDSLPDYGVNNQNGTYSVLPGTVLNIVSTPDTHYYMTRWDDIDSMFNSNDAVTRTDTINADITIGASFTHKPILTLLANDTAMGTASVEGSGDGIVQITDTTYIVNYDKNVNMIATANTGYKFLRWEAVDGQAIGTDSSLSVNVLVDTVFKAIFDTSSYNVTYTVQSDTRDIIGTNEPMGSVTLAGTHSHFLNDTLEATAEYGYTFIGWYSNGSLVSSDNPFVFTPVSDTAFEARFSPVKYAILGTPSDSLAGYVNGSDSVAYLASITLQAFANTGYHFVEWQDANGSVLDTNVSLTVQALSDSVVYAVFDTNIHNLVVNIAEGSENFGSVEGSVAEARHFEEYTIVATADSGYHLVKWMSGNNTVGTTDTMVVSLHSDTVFTAVFDTNTYNLNVVVADTCDGRGIVSGDTVAKHFLSYEISAEANPGYHFVAWSDGDSNATRTVQLVSDSTIEAIFDFNPALTLQYRENNGSMKFIVESQTATFSGITQTSLESTDHAITVNATNADAYGLSLKGNRTVTIVADGDNVIKQVAFHLTNGANRAGSITATPADSVIVANGNAFGSIIGVNSNTVVISSSSDKDINIDQLTIQYAPVLPVGVVHVDGTPSNVYHVVPGTVVQVMATPNQGNYLVSWEGDTTSTDDLIATVTMGESDATVIANFSGDPVMTLAANGNGRIYFESYDGYTVNRDESVLALNVTNFPYTWYEAGTIYEINDPSGMVTKDSTTSHYVSVNGPFTGAATVVTTNGSFAVTCIPTVPNGVTVMSEGIYTIEPGIEVNVVAVPAEDHYLYSWDDIATTESYRSITVTSDTNIVVNFLHNPYILTLESNDVMGTVAPVEGQAAVTANTDGTYTVMADSTVAIVATPADGYHLTEWSNVATTDTTILVTMVNDSTVIAYFDTTRAELAWDTNAFTGYTLIDFNEYKPVLSNPHEVEVRYGIVDSHNGAVTVSADSCNITNFFGGVVATAGTYTIYAVHDLTREYFYDSVAYTLTVKNGALIVLTQNIAEGGTIDFVEPEEDLTHAYTITSNAKMAYLAPAASLRATATANEGYHFTAWQTLMGGDGDFSTADSVTYTAPDTIETSIFVDDLRAIFDTNHYLLVARVMDSCDGCGIVTGTDSAARHFVDYTVTAQATPCYHFVNWTDAVGNILGTDPTMTVSPVSDTMLIANFEANSYTGDTTVDVCDRFTWNDSTYTVTPAVAPTHTYKNVNNCDSVVTLRLTIRHSTTVEDTAVVCDTMNWYEYHNITESTDTLKHNFVSANAQGCDSIATLHLTVYHSSESLLDTTVCNQFTWNNVEYFRSTLAHFDTVNAAGCDSIARLNLTVNQPSESTETVATCDSVYYWNGFIYTSSTLGIYRTTNQYGCDSTATLHLTLNHVFNGIEEHEACESFTWYGITYTESQLDSTVTHTFPGGAANGCDSTSILLLTINHPVNAVDNVTACDSYTWHGTTYTNSTNEPSYTTTGSNGCDSTVTLNLTINNSIENTVSASTCSYYIWNGIYLDSTGSYTRTFTAINGCDSVVTLDLTVSSTVTSSFDVVNCGSYNWNGIEYAASGAYSQTFSSAATGCDSVVTMRLTVKQPTTATVIATACDSYSWNGQTYTQSGSYTYVTTGNNGCDSTTTLQLTVATTGNSVDNVTACDSYTWIDGITYTASTNTPTYVVSGDNCNTVVTLNLTINNSVESSFDAEACGHYLWDNTYYSVSGTYNRTYSATNSCDSVVTMNLTVKQPTAATETVTACDSYEWNGQTYYSTGIYTYVTTGSNGCDSTTTLQLTVNQSTTVNETVTACDSYTWNGQTYTESGSYSNTAVGTNGCDINTTLNLTINSSVESSFDVETCGYYIWDGTYYNTTGAFSKRYAAVNGCDSVVTMNLTVNSAVTTTIADTACESYTWNGVEYTASGVYTQTLETARGCDSVVTLRLTVKRPAAATVIVTACDSYEWNGQTYTVSGSYNYVTTGSNGCDSTTTLQLTIATTGSSVDNVTACDSYTWIDGVTYTASTNTPTYTVSGATCNTVVTLNLTINNSVKDTVVAEACGYYMWENSYYNVSGTYNKTYAAHNSCDSVVTLNLTVKQPTTATVSVTACDSYTWNGQTYYTTGIYNYVTSGSNGCDSTTTLQLTVNRSTTAVVNATACDSYTWNGQTYTQSGSYSYTTTGLNGCDSTTTLLLTVNQSTTATETVTACDSYTWHGVTYTTSTDTPTFTTTGLNGCELVTTLNLTINNRVENSVEASGCNYYIWDGSYYTNTGSYVKSYNALNGCDSVVTLNLTVNHPVSTSITESVCNSYTWNNVQYTVSGVYTQMFSGSNGCDSVVTLALTVNQPRTSIASAIACDSYTWNGQTYTTSGNYTYTTTGSNGCDSIATLQLTINQSTTATETVTACDSYTWHGVTYTASTNTPTFTTTGVNGCDLVTTLNLTINESATGSIETTVCSYYIWEGTYYTVSGSYNKTYAAANGCDSVVTLTLTVNQPVATAISASACNSYTWNNVEYSASGIFTQTLSGANGCDSVVTLTLNIKHPTTATVAQTACDSYTWNGQTYTASGNYTYTTTGSNGCDSTTTLQLTINQSTTAIETVSACGSYTWIDGVTYTASTNTPTYTTTGGNGCDLVTTLHLTINNPVHTAETMEACESYTWNGQTYNASGDYTFSHNDANGCVQVDTLHLTINNPVHQSETAVSCGSYVWHGTTYGATGDYTFSHADANGCIQVDTLHLTIGTSVVVNETVNTCDSYEWNGRTYTESGEYTYTTTTVNGCDSTVVLNLTVNYSTSSIFDTLAYGSYTWNGQTYNESGAYQQTLTTVNGCDSVVTLNLVILPEGFVMPYLYNLMDVMLSVNHNEEGTENVHYIWYRWYRNGELVLEGPNYDNYSEGGSRLNGCYFLEVAVDESMQYWVRSNEVCIGNVDIEEAENIEITLAPNPVRQGSQVMVTVNGADLQGAEIRVYDLKGRMVLEQKDNGVFVAPNATGMYMVRLTLSDGRKAVSKLIVK